MKVTWFTYIIALLFLLACGEAYDTQAPVAGLSTEKKKLLLADTLRIAVDSTTSPIHYYDQVVTLKGNPTYLIYNTNGYSLQAYSLVSGEHLFSIPFSEQGPNGIGSPNWFYYHNPDSIFFIYYDNIKTVSLFNSMGIKNNQWKLEFPDPYDKHWISGELFYQFAFHPETKTLGFWIAQGNAEQLAYQKSMKEVRFNIEQETFTFFGELPESHLAKNYYPNNYINSYTFGDTLVSYYMASHLVKIHALHNPQFSRPLAIKSKFLPDEFSVLITKEGGKIDMQEESDYNKENGFYVKMCSNLEGTYHYRMVKHPSVSTDERDRLQEFFDRDFSIIVLDKGFNIIDEIPFEGGVYDFFQSFALGDRFYMSLNNPQNEIADENHIQFAVFQLYEN